MPVLTSNNETELWENGTFNMGALGLLRAVFIYNGKNFYLRVGTEQCRIKLPQFKRETVQVSGKGISSYIYTEFGSKNRQEGFDSNKKVVPQY